MDGLNPALERGSGVAKRGWWDVLRAARLIDGPNGFTSVDLVAAGNLDDGRASSAGDQASAWLCKFVKWGYAKRKGKDGRRVLYALTKYGKNRPTPKERRS